MLTQKEIIKLNETSEAIFREIKLLEETSKTDKLSKSQLKRLAYLQEKLREQL